MIGKRVARFDNLVLTPLSFMFPVCAVTSLFMHNWWLAGLNVFNWLVITLLGGSLLGATLPKSRTLDDFKQYRSSDPRRWKPDSEMSVTEIRALARAVLVCSAIMGIWVGAFALRYYGSILKAAEFGPAAAIIALAVFGIISNERE